MDTFAWCVKSWWALFWNLVAATAIAMLGGCAVPTMEAAVGTRYSAPLPVESNSLADWEGEAPPPPRISEQAKVPDTKLVDPFKPRPSRTPPEDRPVHVYGPSWCKVCQTIPADGRFVKHKEPFPDWTYTKGQWPILHWQGVDGKWYFQRGWKGEAKLNELIAATDNPQPKTAKPSARQGYPVRGAWWTHPGDVYSHLISSHGYHPEYVRTLSRAEAESLHSDDHEGRVKGNPPKARRNTTMLPLMMRSYCPTCPT